MFDNFLSQLRANPRLRWGIALIVGIFWLYGVLVLREQVQEQTQQYRSASLALARLQAQRAQADWPARLAPAKVMAVQLESKLWQAPTAGLAQAAFQDWINLNIVKAGVANPQISVTLVEDAVSSSASGSTSNNAASSNPDNAIAPTPSDLWKIKAKINIDLGLMSVSDLINKIESDDKQIVVSTFSTRKEPLPRAELELLAYFQKPGTTAASKTNVNTIPGGASGASGASASGAPVVANLPALPPLSPPPSALPQPNAPKPPAPF
ncbi:MAG: hypothetical protein H7Z77_08220 [Chitinophagaceae bacterium]|nr:hypothetical protein [Polaromonas sp.]